MVISMRQIRIIQVGFGSMGIEIFKILRKNKKFKIVGVVDSDKSKIGKDIGIISFNKKIGLKIVRKIDEIKSKIDIVLLTTTSNINDVYTQIFEIAKMKTPIISTCEELVYPQGKNKKIAKKINNLAIKYKIGILGVGVNPGFLMDSMVLMLTGLCNKIENITVTRVVNLAKRRKALQKKMCVGCKVLEFKKTKGNVGHVGLKESAMMISNSLNIKLKMTSKINPIISKNRIKSNGLVVPRGRISGIKHSLVAMRKDSKFLRMQLYMYVGAKEYDLVNIKGEPPVYFKTKGVNGDKATVALLTNYIPIILKSNPGLFTVNKLPMPIFAAKFKT